MKNELKNSNISCDAKLYNNVRCIDSFIGPKCVIGDDCDLINIHMDEKSELGRRNLIRNSYIGKGTYTGTNTIIKNTRIEKYSSISWNVSIGGGNHDFSNMSTYTDYWFNRTFDTDFSIQNKEISTIIGNDVWIAAGVNVIEGITVGDGSVIGAGAVVIHDIPPYAIVAGVPARIINWRFDEEIISLLLDLKWWNWDEKQIVDNIHCLKQTPDKETLLDLLEKYKYHSYSED